MFLHNNTYTNNTADVSGGAVHFQIEVEIGSPSHIQGGLVVSSSSFVNNAADMDVGHGGALSVYGGNSELREVPSSGEKPTWTNRLQISSSFFHRNTAFMGGALFATGDTTDSDPVQISPSIVVHDASKLRLVSDFIETSTFRENTAGVQGGGVSVMHIYGGVTVESSTLELNLAKGMIMCPQGDETCAGSGGGIISVYAPLTVVKTIFRNNTAETNTEFPPRAGALFAFYDTHGTLDPNDDVIPKALTLTGGEFFGNVANSKTSSSSTGGAIWINGGATIEDVFFTANMAVSETIHSLEYNAGGAIYVQRSGAIIPDKNFTDGPIRMYNNTFTANEVKPGGYGGALFAKGSTEIEVINQRFINNIVTSSQRIKSAGGAVAFVSGVTSTVTESYFHGNSAVPYQGQTTILHVSGSTMPMPDGLSGEAGALFLEASSSIVEATTFKDNFCRSGGSDQGASGGAVSIISYLEDSAAAYMPTFPRQPIFRRVNFISNSADSADKQGFTIADKSSGMGGAVHVISAAPEFVDCYFGDNYARAGGSKVSLGGAVALRYAYATPSVMSPNGFLNLPQSYLYSPEEKAFYERSPKFIGCTFTANKAMGENSDGNYGSSTLSIMQSGRGGAIGAVASMPFVANSTFHKNSATARSRSVVPSLGGAVYLDYDSEGCFVFTNFSLNVAENGAGNEICSISVNTEDVDEKDEAKYQESFQNSSLLFRACDFSGASVSSSDSVSDQELSSSAVSAPLSGWPNLLIFGGSTKLLECTFTNKTSIIVAGPGFKDIFGPYLDDVVLGYAKLFIGGNMDSPKVDIFSWNADLFFSSLSHNKTTTLDGLNIVNGTLNSSSGITVEGNAWIFGAKLCGCDRFENELGGGYGQDATLPSLPIFKVEELTFGRPDASIFPASFLKHYPKADSEVFSSIFSKHAPITIDFLDVSITGSTLPNSTHRGLFSVSIPLIHLNNSASITIEAGGELRLKTATTFQEHLNPNGVTALVSRGGATINHTRIDPDHDDIASLTVLGGDFHMEKGGVVPLVLPSVDDWQGAIWNFEGGALIEGTIYCAFNSSSIIDEQQSWKIVSYLESSSRIRGKEDDELDVTIFSPDEGVRLNAQPNSANHLFESIQVGSIKCESILDYHKDGDNWANDKNPCQICLQGSGSCSFCADSENPTDPKQCKDEATADTLPFGTCSAMNCCAGECSDHGVCSEDEELHPDGPTCECEWFFEGVSCSVISTSGTLMLTSGVSLTLLCLISVAYYQFHNRTKREVVENALEELRVGLLASEDNTETGKKGSIHVGSTYIQDLQQQLLLKDVAVPIEEVNIGQEIGSGTYGVVYKGNFRGSAVAIKMVRAFGMGDAEIENFKKEAYLMSKLRHPNIVLIMGIAMKNLTSARTFSSSSRASSDDMER